VSERKPQVYFTSDWHIGHANVLKFCSRPFTDVEHQSRVLVNNYNSTVPPHGVCYFLGDMGLCDVGTLRAVIDQLNGTKVLILGNHDAGTQKMYRAGFDVVLYSAGLQIAGERVTMSHCPLRGIPRENLDGMHGVVPGDNWHGEHKSRQFSLRDEGQFHLSGHIHSPNRGRSTKILGRQYDVGVDANNYTPVSISEIESWIAKTKQ
jgi:calcineurin-like phosphoesterase family protein